MEGWKRWRVTLVLAALALGGLGGLYAFSKTLGPTTLPISSIGPGDVGSLIRVSGLLKDPFPTSAGGLGFNLVEPQGEATLHVYLPGGVYAQLESRGDLIPGAVVEVVGEVQQYQGQLEILVSRASDVKILTNALENRIPIPVVAKNPSAFKGMTIIVEGRLQDFRVLRSEGGELVGTAFSLSDRSGDVEYTLHCVLFGWDWRSDPRGISPAMVVSFRGTLGYYDREAQWQVTSEEFTLTVLAAGG